MEKGIIYYEPKWRRSAPQLLAAGEARLSLNPYLPIHGLLPSDYDETPKLLDLKQLLQAADELIFLAYLEDPRVEVGKCRTELALEGGEPVPQQAVEAAVVARGPAVQELLAQAKPATLSEAEEALKWTQALSHLKRLTEKIAKLLRERKYFSLDAYYTLKRSGEAPKPVPEAEEILTLIHEYDTKHLPRIVREACSES